MVSVVSRDTYYSTLHVYYTHIQLNIHTYIHTHHRYIHRVRRVYLRVSTSQHELVGAVCGEAQTQQSDGHREGATVCHWCPHLLVNVLLQGSKFRVTLNTIKFYFTKQIISYLMSTT